MAAWLVLAAIAMPMMRRQSDGAVALAALGALVVGVWCRPLRAHWRPISGWIGLRVSRSLRPGDRAWFVRHGRADSVLVTARQGFRLALAGVALGETESMSVRRTRVFVVPHDGP